MNDPFESENIYYETYSSTDSLDSDDLQVDTISVDIWEKCICDENNNFVEFQDISLENDFEKLELRLSIEDFTIKRMMFTNPNITKLSIKTTLNTHHELFDGVSCMPNLELIKMTYYDEEIESKISFNIDYLKSIKSLKTIVIFANKLDEKTDKELIDYCDENNICYDYFLNK